MKSINHHNTTDPPGRAVGHQKKAASSSGSSKKKTPVTSGSPAVQDDKESSASNRYKNYAGISPRSVKCYWEQYNNHETECQDEVYLRVAEDVTYKLWELGNALKVYSRHTGGTVTTDLVNVVLKDMNVAPVLGANSSNWDTLDCDDGCYYFNSDRVVDLREEYLKEYQMLQPGPTSVTSTWVVEDEISEDLLDLFDKLCDAIFLGDEETFVAALEIADSHPFVCGIISLLLNKCTEMLAFDYKRGTLERTMKFLIALTGNSYLDQNHVNLELYYLSQLLINLLLGADNDKYFESLPKLTNGEGDLFGAAGTSVAATSIPVGVVPGGGSAEEGEPQAVLPMGDFNELVGNLMEYTETPLVAAATGGGMTGVVIKTEIGDEEMMIKRLEQEQQHGRDEESIVGSDLFNGIEGGTINATTTATVAGTGELKHDYEALFIMMDNGEFGMKKLEDASFQIKSEPLPEFVEGGVGDGSTTAANASASLQILTELKQESNFVERSGVAASNGASIAVNCGVEDVVVAAEELESNDEEEEEDDEGEEAAEEEEMCVITTKMCDTEDVALVCQCMGRLAGFWSYMYRECSYLLLKRVEQFFLGGVILLKCEYEWLVRAIQAVFALGEVPFREFSAYVDKLHVTITPDWVTVQLNCCGVFLRDQQDGELYDLLYELCGDAILPFMLYRFTILKSLAELSVRSRVIKFRIVSKVVPKYLECTQNSERRQRMELEKNDCESTLDSWFEERTRHKILPRKSPRIGFKFAGCRPVATVKQEREMERDEQMKSEALRRRKETTTTTDRPCKVVIAARKLLRPLTNVKRFTTLYDLSSIHF